MIVVGTLTSSAALGHERTSAIETDFALTDHAAARRDQRNLSDAEIEYVIAHGQRVHRAGACAFFLGRNDIPGGDRANQRIAQLVGTVVLLNVKHGEVITVYRNRKNGLKEYRRKPKYSCSRRPVAVENCPN
jgi:hypothetical protein